MFLFHCYSSPYPGTLVGVGFRHTINFFNLLSLFIEPAYQLVIANSFTTPDSGYGDFDEDAHLAFMGVNMGVLVDVGLTPFH